ncbi:MAG TPA: hypothetical protein VJY42_04280 [Candidatus Methanomethylophilaceae archaeon]|nr:hypothetical protein [Candidatus Methanomethylophilaceae archaeon]
MAKKKRRIKEEPKETYEFTPAEFDEREFILKELFNTKLFFVAITLAILSGMVWAFVFTLGEHTWIIGLLFCILIMAGMKKIIGLLGIKVEMIQGKAMIANYIMFFLLATGIAILLINAPFYLG